MNYFDYTPMRQQNMGVIWGLFSSLGERSEEEIINSRVYAHTVEIIGAAMSGAINPNEFNLKGYEYACARNERLGLRNKVKDELNIVFGSSEEENRVGYGDVRGESLRNNTDYFKGVLDDLQSEQCMGELLRLRKKYLVKYRVDVVKLMRFALESHVPSAIEKLASLVKVEPKLKELLSDISVESSRLNYI